MTERSERMKSKREFLEIELELVRIDLMITQAETGGDGGIRTLGTSNPRTAV